MRISDWSSDVCSSDLDAGPIAVACTLEHGGGGKRARRSIAQVVEADGAHRLRRHISVVTQSEAERTHLLRQRQLLRIKLRYLKRGGFHHHRLVGVFAGLLVDAQDRSEEHTSELQSLMRISYAVFCLKKKNTKSHIQTIT